MSDMPSFGTPPPAPPAPRAEETPSAQAELTKSNEVGLSWLKEIEGELAAEAAKDPIIIRVPDMPNRTGWGLIVDPNVDHREFKQWLRNAGENEKKQRDADNTLFCIEIIKNKTTGFMKDGRRLTHNGDEDGDDMNFADPIMQSLLGVKGKPDSTKLAVRRLIANDAHIQAIGKAILDAAGYGENVEVENPTTGV